MYDTEHTVWAYRTNANDVFIQLILFLKHPYQIPNMSIRKLHFISSNLLWNGQGRKRDVLEIAWNFPEKNIINICWMFLQTNRNIGHKNWLKQISIICYWPSIGKTYLSFPSGTVYVIYEKKVEINTEKTFFFTFHSIHSVAFSMKSITLVRSFICCCYCDMVCAPLKTCVA